MLNIPMDKEKSDRVRLVAAKNGFDFSQNSGTVSKDGVTIQYQFYGDHVEIEVVKTSFWKPKPVVEGYIANFVNNA